VPVGSLNLEGAVGGEPDGKLVVLFMQEIKNIQTPIETHLEILRACAALARKYPDYRFLVKTKDLQDIDRFLSDEGFRKDCEAAPNFSFARLARYEGCAELLRRADIVISAAITTPGCDAVLAGKPTILYSDMGLGWSPMSKLEGLMVETPAELEKRFDDAAAGRGPGRGAADLLKGLEPFRDGAARRRMIDAILDA
jgi:hypothetical protein